MARSKRKPLRPMRELSKRQQNERRRARRLGFKSEYDLRKWIRESRSLSPNDPRYMREGIKTTDEVQLARLRKVGKRYRTPAKTIRDKKRYIVDNPDNEKKMSAFAFLELYLSLIKSILANPSTSEYEKRQLRKILHDMQSDVTRVEKRNKQKEEVKHVRAQFSHAKPTVSAPVKYDKYSHKYYNPETLEGLIEGEDY